MHLEDGIVPLAVGLYENVFISMVGGGLLLYTYGGGFIRNNMKIKKAINHYFGMRNGKMDWDELPVFPILGMIYIIMIIWTHWMCTYPWF